MQLAGEHCICQKEIRVGRAWAMSCRENEQRWKRRVAEQLALVPQKLDTKRSQCSSVE